MSLINFSTTSIKTDNILSDNTLKIRSTYGGIEFNDLYYGDMRIKTIDDGTNYIATVWKGSGDDSPTYNNLFIGVKTTGGEARPIIGAIDPTLTTYKTMWINPNSNIIIGDRDSSFATDFKLAIDGNALVFGNLTAAAITSTAITNQLKFNFTTNLNPVYINVNEPTAPREYTIPDIENSDFVFTNGIQTLNDKILNNTTLTGSLITSALEIVNAAPEIKLTHSGAFTTNITVSPTTADLTINIPDVQTNSNFVLTEGAQTLNGAKTFSAQILAQSGINLSTGQSYNINGVSVLNSTTLGASIVNSTIATNTANFKNIGTISIQNGGGFSAIFDPVNILASDKTYTLPNKNGTIALTSDIPPAFVKFSGNSSTTINTGTYVTVLTLPYLGSTIIQNITNIYAVLSVSIFATTRADVLITDVTNSVTISSNLNITGFTGNNIPRVVLLTLSNTGSVGPAVLTVGVRRSAGTGTVILHSIIAI